MLFQLPGYPWWPSLVCNHPTEGKAYRKGEIHVQFFDNPVARSWVSDSLVKKWSEGHGTVTRPPTSRPDFANWEKGVADGEKVAGMTNEERLDTLLVELLPSDEEDDWDGQEVSYNYSSIS